MSELFRSDIVNVDINKSLNRMYVGSVLATGDEYANRFGANVFRAGEPVSLDGCSVMGYFIRNERETVVIKGAVSGNMAYVDLPQACYAERGSFSLAIKASSNGVTHTVRIVDGYIRMTQTDVLIDPGDVVPSLDDILAQIAAMEAVTAEANETITTIKADTAEAVAETMAAAADTRLATQELSATTAPPIIPTATGDGLITVNDSANRPIAGLTLYGKTTQDGMPTPDNPMDLVTAGNDGDIGVTVAGRNIFNKDNYAVSGVFIQVGANALVHTPDRGIILPAAPDTTYTVSKATKTTMRVATCVEYPAENVLCTTVAYHAEASNAALTVTSGKNDRWMLVQLFANTDLDGEYGSIDANAASLQVEIGSVATAYEPYKDGGSVAVATPNGLPGIPVSSGGNYTDSTGQQWICDEVDFGRGVFVQRVRTRTLDGTESAWYSGDKNIYITLTDCVKTGRTGAMCDQYAFVNKNPSNLSAGEMTQGATVHNLCFANPDNVLTKDEWKAQLAENPLTVLYPLSVPVETALSDEALTAYAAMLTQYPNTNVVNDAGAGMQIAYVADTENWNKGAATSMIGTVESGMVASRNYAIGDFIVDKDALTLYRATATIANGESIKPGTNCVPTTVIEQLANLYSLLNA